MPTPSAALPPPTNIVIVVAVSVFCSSSAYSRNTRTSSPWNFSGQWQFSQVKRAGRMLCTGDGTGLGTLSVAICQSWRVPAIFDSTSAPTPGPTWHATQAHARVRPALVRDVLRLHRRMADLAAELGRLHVVHRAERRHREEHEVARTVSDDARAR